MAVVDPDEVFRRAVRSFYEGAGFPELEKSTGKKIRHSKDFFDSYEKELRPKKKGKDKAHEAKESKEQELIEMEEEV